MASPTEEVKKMVRWVFVGFLVAHGLVHLIVWTSSSTAKAQGTNPDHSWMLGDQHSIVVSMTYVATAMFVFAGAALLFQMEMWRVVTVVAAAASLVLVALFPDAIMDAWILAPVGINVALIAGVAWLDWPSRTMVGV
jgi:hypothetical protein